MAYLVLTADVPLSNYCYFTVSLFWLLICVVVSCHKHR